jgi:hypothetical protein
LDAINTCLGGLEIRQGEMQHTLNTHVKTMADWWLQQQQRQLQQQQGMEQLNAMLRK